MNQVIAYVNIDQRYNQDDIKRWNNLAKSNLPNIRYMYFPNIQSLFPKLSDPNIQIDFINLDVEIIQSFNDGNPYAIVSTLKILSESTLFRDINGKTKKRQTKIFGVVGIDSPVDVIKEMQSLVDGLVMRACDKWTMEMVLTDQKRILSGDFSIPKEVKKILKKEKKNTITEVDAIQLTPRQKQVFTLVTKRGASNKIIAKTLQISESTVKLHVGAILRKYGLKNRTQLVVFAKEAP